MTAPTLTDGPSPGGALPSMFQPQTPRREMSLVGRSGPGEGSVHSSAPWLKCPHAQVPRPSMDQVRLRGSGPRAELWGPEPCSHSHQKAVWFHSAFRARHTGQHPTLLTTRHLTGVALPSPISQEVPEGTDPDTPGAQLLCRAGGSVGLTLAQPEGRLPWAWTPLTGHLRAGTLTWSEMCPPPSTHTVPG